MHGFPSPINPGERLQVSGFNLGTDLAVRVVLEKDGNRWILGEAVCDGQGQLSDTFLVPAELKSGVYSLTVVDPSVAGRENTMASQAIRVGAPSWLERIGPGPMIAAGLVFLGGIALVYAMRGRLRRGTPGPPAH